MKLDSLLRLHSPVRWGRSGKFHNKGFLLRNWLGDILLLLSDGPVGKKLLVWKPTTHFSKYSSKYGKRQELILYKLSSDQQHSCSLSSFVTTHFRFSQTDRGVLHTLVRNSMWLLHNMDFSGRFYAIISLKHIGKRHSRDWLPPNELIIYDIR